MQPPSAFAKPVPAHKISSANPIVARNSASSSAVMDKGKAPTKPTNPEPRRNETPSGPAAEIQDHRLPDNNLAGFVTNTVRKSVISPQSPKNITPVGLRPGITFEAGGNASAPSSPARHPFTTAQAANKYGQLNEDRQIDFLKLLFEHTTPGLKKQVLALAEMHIKLPLATGPNSANKSTAFPTTPNVPQKTPAEKIAESLQARPKETEEVQQNPPPPLSLKSKFLATLEEKERIETARLLEQERLEKQNPLKRSRNVFDQDQDNEDDTWEVDEVIEKRIRHEYLVSWKGRGLDEQQWVTANSFTHAREARAMLESRANVAFGGSLVGDTIVVAPPLATIESKTGFPHIPSVSPRWKPSTETYLSTGNP